MTNISTKDLKIKFIETLNLADEFTYEKGNPFFALIDGKQYFVFLKNLSPAYFANSPDITRVQLPYSPHFSKVIRAKVPFLILGFDSDMDVIVSWNPKLIRERLNARSNVSLYSRKSLQQNVETNEFKVGYLSNGEKIIVFHRNKLITFFKEYKSLFKSNLNKQLKLIELERVEEQEGPEFYKWLKGKYALKTAKNYFQGLNKVYSDLKSVSMITQDSLLQINQPDVLRDLYDKWYSVLKFARYDKVEAKYMYSNAFKRYIEFREEQFGAKRSIKNSVKRIEKKTDQEELFEISDKEILHQIRPLLKKNQVLQAVELTAKYYSSKHKEKSFKDWYTIVSALYRKMNT